MKILRSVVVASAFIVLALAGTADSPGVQVSIVTTTDAGAPVRHGVEKLETALRAKGVRYEEVASLHAGHGQILIVAGHKASSPDVDEQVKNLGITVPSPPESLVIHSARWEQKPLLLLTGSDDRGLMYGLLEVANRIGWAASATNPLSEIHLTQLSLHQSMIVE